MSRFTTRSFEGGAGGGREGGDVLVADDAARDGDRVARAPELGDDERRRHHFAVLVYIL